MIHETEKTFLMYYKTKEKEVKCITDLFNVSILVNLKGNVITLICDKELNLTSELERFTLDITNDPKTDAKFCINNLGYYSIRIESFKGKAYKVGKKTFITFKPENFNLFLNLSLYLPLINDKNFTSLFSFDSDLYFIGFKFRTNTYDIDTTIWENDIEFNFYMNLLEIENNYISKSRRKLDLGSLLKKENIT